MPIPDFKMFVVDARLNSTFYVEYYFHDQRVFHILFPLFSIFHPQGDAEVDSVECSTL